MKKFLYISLFGLFGTAFAALAPLNESIAELDALLSDNQLTMQLGSGEPLLEIIRTADGYLLLTPNYRLRVDVIYLSQKRPGPQKFKLVFHSPISINEGN